MRWLVTGGAGYIGSHVAKTLVANGHDAIVLDDLSNGIRSRVTSTIPFVHASIHDDDLFDVMNEVNGVIHLAGLKSVSESEQFPAKYYSENVEGTLNVIRAMKYARVKRFIFSSTASVYSPFLFPVDEDSRLSPKSVYGQTKYVAEQMIEQIATPDWSIAILRYFNVIGCGEARLADTSKDNLLPSVFRALEKKDKANIYGNDYPTPDGTCVRDYVHVEDVAEAHLAIANSIDQLPHNTYNVGTGVGVSVREMVETIFDVANAKGEYRVLPRRAGDCAMSVAAVDRIRQDLGWEATRDFRDGVQSQWDARNANASRGYSRSMIDTM